MRSLALTAALVLAACASPHAPDFVRAMHAAEDLESRGSYVDAARAFDLAATATPRSADRDEALHAGATMLARGGDVSAALARLDALASANPPGPEAASSAYDAASLRIDHVDPDVGFRELDEMLHRFPDDVASRPALHRLLAHKDETVGPAGTLAYLRQLLLELHAKDREEELAYEVARRLEATGQTEAARDAFLAIATRWPYPNGALWDDALYHASVLDEVAGRPNDAVADLELMLKERERAILVGSAERARYADAELHVGELYRDKLGDHRKAELAFHRLYAEFPTSPIRDRGLFEEAELLLADGDTKGACERLETLVEKIPDSRYAPCAERDCPALRARPAATAPRGCHAYIDRRMRPVGR